MFNANHQILFEGGPHDGLFVVVNRMPANTVTVPADQCWRNRPQFESACMSGKLAATYVLSGTRRLDGTADEAVTWVYRFLTFYAQPMRDRDRQPVAPGSLVA